MRPQIPACVPSPAVLVVGWATAALVPSVGPWHLFIGGTEQKDCVCPHLSEGLPWAPASLGTRSGWEVVVLFQNIVRQTTFQCVPTETYTGCLRPGRKSRREILRITGAVTTARAPE